MLWFAYIVALLRATSMSAAVRKFCWFRFANRALVESSMLPAPLDGLVDSVVTFIVLCAVGLGGGIALLIAVAVALAIRLERAHLARVRQEGVVLESGRTRGDMLGYWRAGRHTPRHMLLSGPIHLILTERALILVSGNYQPFRVERHDFARLGVQARGDMLEVALAGAAWSPLTIRVDAPSRWLAELGARGAYLPPGAC